MRILKGQAFRGLRFHLRFTPRSEFSNEAPRVGDCAGSEVTRRLPERCQRGIGFRTQVFEFLYSLERGGRRDDLNSRLIAPLPTLYGEHPGVENPAGDHVRVGVGEVIDGGQQVIVLFSAVNPTHHAILLVPPQVQLGGTSKHGKLHRARWTTAEQLPVEDFRLSTRRLAPGERGDGVVLFERPPYKLSSETLFLQVADAGAVDRPAPRPLRGRP